MYFFQEVHRNNGSRVIEWNIVWCVVLPSNGIAVNEVMHVSDRFSGVASGKWNDMKVSGCELQSSNGWYPMMECSSGSLDWLLVLLILLPYRLLDEVNSTLNGRQLGGDGKSIDRPGDHAIFRSIPWRWTPIALRFDAVHPLQVSVHLCHFLRWIDYDCRVKREK